MLKTIISFSFTLAILSTSIWHFARGYFFKTNEKTNPRLEAFVYDPLISWRLHDQSDGELVEETETAKISSDEEQPASGITQTEPSAAQDTGLALHLAPIDQQNMPTTVGQSSMPEPIQEGQEEEDDDTQDDGSSDGSCLADEYQAPSTRKVATSAAAASHAKSLKMYSEMKSLAANFSTSSRIASLTGGTLVGASLEQGSMARSRVNKSVRQRELLSVLGYSGDQNSTEEALNERALKVIRRVQNKLAGTDFHPPGEDIGEPLDVQDQVQRLIAQATSSENLCQLFIGWCAFW